MGNFQISFKTKIIGNDPARIPELYPWNLPDLTNPGNDFVAVNLRY